MVFQAKTQANFLQLNRAPVRLQDPPPGRPRGHIDCPGEAEAARGGQAAPRGGAGIAPDIPRGEHILHGLPSAGRADGAQQGVFGCPVSLQRVVYQVVHCLLL